MNYVTLNNGVSIPQLGFGVWKVPNDEAKPAVSKAIEIGYRLIDTAMIYKNEEGVGQAVKESGIPREELFITTKVWNSDHGYDNTLRAFDDNLQRLGMDYVDLYLIHWPAPQFEQYVDTYKALETLYKDGRVKAIGVCNFDINHLEKIMEECEVVPVVNQVECHPYFQQKELKDFCKKSNIIVEAYSPLMNGKDVLKDEVIKGLAEKYGRTPAQVILRWHIQTGVVVIPKSVTPSRIEENFKVFDFELNEEDMSKIAHIDKGIRNGGIPSEFHRR